MTHSLINNYDTLNILQFQKTGFSFNNELFNDPSGMIKYLNSKGVRLGLNINPTEGIYSIENYYEKAKDYLKPDEKGVIPFNIYDSKLNSESLNNLE